MIAATETAGYTRIPDSNVIYDSSETPGWMAIEVWNKINLNGRDWWKVTMIDRGGDAIGIGMVEWWVNTVVTDIAIPGLYVIEDIFETDDLHTYGSVRMATDDEYDRWIDDITAIHRYFYLRSKTDVGLTNELEQELLVRRFLWKVVLNIAWSSGDKKLAQMGSLYYELMDGTPFEDTKFAKDYASDIKNKK